MKRGESYMVDKLIIASAIVLAALMFQTGGKKAEEVKDSEYYRKQEEYRYAVTQAEYQRQREAAQVKAATEKSQADVAELRAEVERLKAERMQTKRSSKVGAPSSVDTGSETRKIANQAASVK
jgi:hypothetical protein